MCVCVCTEKKWTIYTIWTRHCKSDEEGRALVCLVTFTCSVDRALSASIYVTLYTAHSPLSIRRNTDFYQLLRHEPITWKTLSSPLISRLFPSIPPRILFVHRFLSLQALPCPRFRFISHTDTPCHRQASRQITSLLLRNRSNFDRSIAKGLKRVPSELTLSQESMYILTTLFSLGYFFLRLWFELSILSVIRFFTQIHISSIIYISWSWKLTICILFSNVF